VEEKNKSVAEGYLYAACPYCRKTLLQGKNGTDAVIKCQHCGVFVHVIIKGGEVSIAAKDGA